MSASAHAPLDSVSSALRNGLTSVVIVAADSGPGLADCVAAVLAGSGDVEVIVSDNDSRDGSLEAVTVRCGADPRLRILRNGANLGFGAGCNRAAGFGHGDALLFLNPDCVIRADTIVRLRAALAPAVGLLGVAIVDAAARREPASRRRDPTLWRTLMTLSGLAHFEAHWPALAGIDLPAATRLPDVEPVDAVSGALMLVPRTVFERIGGFDEGYFLHAEDLDLCRRVRDAGYTVACVNTIEIVHGKGGSSRRRPLFVAWHKHRGLWRWFRKFDPAARNPLLRALVWAGLWLRFAALTPVIAWRQWRARGEKGEGMARRTA